MKDGSRNIYRIARDTAGLTQERWAENLGISVEAVRQYEAGIIMPGDDIVLQMSEISGQLILPYRHLVRKSRVAAAILPELDDELGLSESVLSLLIQIDDFREDGLRKLTRIAADGKVSPDETEDYDAAMQQLLRLVSLAMSMSYIK